MNTSNATKVVTTENLAWTKSMRQHIQKYISPGTEDAKWMRPIFIDIEYLRKQNFVAVPIIGFWRTRAEPIIGRQLLENHPPFYGIGFDIETDEVLSSSSDLVSISDLIHDLFGHCVIFPRDESLIMVHTILDYWIVAGPAELVAAFCRESIANALEEFLELAIEWDYQFEAGAPFANFIYRLYMEHNTRIMQGV